MAPKYQANRSVQITSPLKDDLLFKRMSAVEALSQPFHFDITFQSPKGDLDPDKILGKELTITMNVGTAELKKRFFHGIVTEFSQVDYNERMHEYRGIVRPKLWMLTRMADCRVFQKMTVPAILKKVLEESGVKDLQLKLKGTHEEWEYCVQYRETDFNFVSRLMEQEGIFYFFEHAEGKHTMVLVDDVASLESVKGYEDVPFFPPSTTDTQRTRDHLSSWAFQKAIHPNQFAVRDYDFEKPANLLQGTSAVLRGGDTKLEIYDWPAEAPKLDHATCEAISMVRAHELQTPYMIARGAGDAAGLTVGKTFKLKQHPRASLNVKYMVTSTSIELASDDIKTGGQGGVPQFSISVEAGDAVGPWAPPRITPKPVIHGAQTAEVVGPAGDEIHVDKYSRVKVQFHWDRYGKKDENSSCFVRVATPWAGKEWGMIHIPRIGQEVVVSFLEGDPDQPIILGSVYNGTHMPPYELPAKMNRSGIVSRSTKGGTNANANEIRLDDTKGSEQLFIHAEKNQDIEVENDETHKVGHDRQKSVENNEEVSIGKNRTESVGESEQITIGKNRTESVAENETISIGKDQTLSVTKSRVKSVGKDETVSISENHTESVGKNENLSIGKNRTTTISEKDALSVGKQLVIDAGEQVTIQTGSASIIMKKDGTITIKGKDITLEGSGKINVKASSDVVIKGSKVTQN